ncbi:uncharacterized protein L969DRAFT_90508 [Mixia osmundae IAM 14324]|uniref:CHCH domain-containing protein n=1 Tax=Mixia osmundae (strain CBS 9802 / IAM 14324 / JCM 22182 / KY 12970) TaxID=764103 RepID=G7E2M8_MIXOS|nr:uncharacterized protein L969DRAFT_90508 [Mixia osmundae IAM 14324]KEI36953.1 hypothetical protein L969DRAFT_90508 [Mixia osmundae IAM 14324]GAA97088.1 hypothetical protein E5Q_03763 [Mixia osmundae IAM 14324]
MHIPKLKIKPGKLTAEAACGPEMAALLACFASLTSTEAALEAKSQSTRCQDSVRSFQRCMAKAGKYQKLNKPTINYHLARLGKNLV